jgi:hypothetical protein
MTMYVMKRDGKRESVHFDKITSRISKLCNGLDSKVRESDKEESKDAANMARYSLITILSLLFSNHCSTWTQ